MVKIAANLSTLFTEVDFLDRFDLAAAHGVEAVEFWYPYAYNVADVRERISRNKLTVLGFNTPFGSEQRGDWGLSADPGRIAEGRAAIDQAIDYAAALGAPAIHVMAGIVPDGTDLGASEQAYVDNLAYAADMAAPLDIGILVEALSPQSRPGYLIPTQEKANELRGRAARKNIKLQFDVYHTQLAEGDLENRIRRFYPYIGHFQIASAPLRHEPDEGEINYKHIFQVIDDQGWDGYVSAEYFPRNGTVEGLTWLQTLGVNFKGEPA